MGLIPGIHVFFNRGVFIIDMLSYAIVDEACSATNTCILLTAAVTPDQVHYIKKLLKKHMYSCQNEDYKGIEVKIVTNENDPANLRLYEAFHIRKYKPTLNSRECTEFADLLF